VVEINKVEHRHPVLSCVSTILRCVGSGRAQWQEKARGQQQVVINQIKCSNTDLSILKETTNPNTVHCKHKRRGRTSVSGVTRKKEKTSLRKMNRYTPGGIQKKNNLRQEVDIQCNKQTRVDEPIKLPSSLTGSSGGNHCTGSNCQAS
jgi:REP element-mobilizing transposase RayT